MSPIIKVGACQHPLGDTAFHCAPLFPQSPEGALLVSQNIVAGGTHLIWSQVDEHALQGTELSEEGRGLRWTLEQGPRRGRETWMGGLNEKGKEILVPKCSQALFTGLSSGSLEKSSSLTVSLETRFLVWNSEGRGKRQCLGMGSRTCSSSSAQERCDSGSWWQVK